MNNLKISNILFPLATISILIILIRGSDVTNIKELYEEIEAVVTIDTLIFVWFSKWGWKKKIFQNWLVPFPDLSGTWKGEIHSSWSDNGEDSPRKIKAFLVINQSFLTTSCILYTEQMTSYSYSEQFDIDPDAQIRFLVFSYSSDPRQLLTENNPPHEGTSKLKIVESPKLRLVGGYWTNRKTKGEMTFDFEKKELMDEYLEI